MSEKSLKPVRGGDRTSNRDSNIELYRILAMLLIVAHHYVVNSGLKAVDGPIYYDPLSWRSIFLLIFGSWGKTGINCFVLISGYFLCKSKISIRKFLQLLLEWMFYRILIQSIFWITGYEALTLNFFLRTVIPITQVGGGFTSSFILFYLAVPFLNILVQNINEKQHRYLLLWCGFTYVLMGTIPFFTVTMNYVSWFIVIYFIASYIRLYPKEVYTRTSLWGWLTAVSFLTAILSIVVCTWIGNRMDKGSSYSYLFVSDANNFLAVCCGVCSFMWFKNLPVRQSKWINALASSTFGVFLIHASSDTMRQWLWKDVVDCVGRYGDKYMPLYAIGSVAMIFMMCVVIDQLRIRLIEKPLFNIIDDRLDRLDGSYIGGDT